MDRPRLQRTKRTIADCKQRTRNAAEATPELAEPLRRAEQALDEADRLASRILREGIVR